MQTPAWKEQRNRSSPTSLPSEKNKNKFKRNNVIPILILVQVSWTLWWPFHPADSGRRPGLFSGRGSWSGGQVPVGLPNSGGGQTSSVSSKWASSLPPLVNHELFPLLYGVPLITYAKHFNNHCELKCVQCICYTIHNSRKIKLDNHIYTLFVFIFSVFFSFLFFI